MQRPTSWTVFGILNICLGSLYVLMTAFALISRKILPNPTMDEMEKNALYAGFTMISLPLNIVLGAALVVAGIGLLRFRPHGRQLSRIYAGCELAMTVLGTLLSVLVMEVSVQAMMTTAGMTRSAALAMLVTTTIVAVALKLSYPILLLIFMRRDPRAALSEAIEREGGADAANPFAPPSRT